MNKVGEARSEPNANPFLPPPVGRISFSLNPLKMFVSILSFPLTYSIAITGRPSTEKKDLLLLLLGSLLRSLHHVLAYDPLTVTYCSYHGSLLLKTTSSCVDFLLLSILNTPSSYLAFF